MNVLRLDIHFFCAVSNIEVKISNKYEIAGISLGSYTTN